MIDELRHLESEHSNALRDIELARQRAMKVADAEYLAAALSVDAEYERRKADLMKGDRAVPQVPLFTEDDGELASAPPPEGKYYCIPANTRREAAENFDKGVYLHISLTNATDPVQEETAETMPDKENGAAK